WSFQSRFTPGSERQMECQQSSRRTGRPANDIGPRMTWGRRFVWRAGRMSKESTYSETRFTHDSRRDGLWRTLYRYCFSRLISQGDCVLELGAGYSHFINHTTTARRPAGPASGEIDL